MLKRVDPLRRELKTLERQSEETKLKAEEMDKIIQELEQSIGKYKEEYAVLISEANAIKADLSTVEAKVGLKHEVHSSVTLQRSGILGKESVL